jgi:hypothetical protein
MSMEKGSGFIVKYRFAAGPIYSESQPRRNIFFSQVIKPFVCSSVHEKHGRQTVVAFSDFRILVSALRQEPIYSFFDDFDFDGLSCFHLGTNLPAPAKTSTNLSNYF